MNNTGKYMRIFYALREAMELAEELGDTEVFKILKQTGDTIADTLDKRNGTPYNPTGDCISREALKEVIEEKVTYIDRDSVDKIIDLIDNAPTVEPFTQLEKEEIADAITYLLDAELLEENGYTEEVINALKSALKKVGGAE